MSIRLPAFAPSPLVPIVLVPLAIALLVPSLASAQLDTDTQKCIDFYNNKLRVVSKTRAKQDRTCIKNATRGKEPNVEGCFGIDVKGKVDKFRQKAIDLTEDGVKGKCRTFPAGAPAGDPIYLGDTTQAADDHVAAASQLMRDVFGDPVSDAIFDAANKDVGRCQDKVALRAIQLLDAQLKEHRTCKRLGLREGSILGAAGLEAECLSDLSTNGVPDPKGKISKKVSKLNADIDKFCAGSVDLDAAVPGLCVGGGVQNDFKACVGARVACTTCEILNLVDGTERDCDIVDDGAANASCGIPTLGNHKCTFDGGASQISVITAALPLSLPASGAIDISCGAIDEATGKAPCDCAVQAFDPVIIPAIGDVCVSPAGPCAPGEIDCDGGNALDIAVTGDHSVGFCASNLQCANICASVCGAATVIDSGCEGFCKGGSNDNGLCAEDADCPLGNCVGGNPVTHSNSCNCVCGEIANGGPSPAGGLTCNLGVQINVELPSTGACGDATPSIVLPPTCGPLTTTAATGTLLNANFNIPAPTTISDSNAPLTGAPIQCLDLETSVTSGLVLNGYLAFFDSTLGDILAANTFVCD